jgi:hypothetical protein
MSKQPLVNTSGRGSRATLAASASGATILASNAGGGTSAIA